MHRVEAAAPRRKRQSRCLLAETADLVRHALVGLACLDDESADHIAGALMDEVAKRWGGRQFYVQKTPEGREQQRLEMANPAGRNARSPTPVFDGISQALQTLLCAQGCREEKATLIAAKVRERIADHWSSDCAYITKRWRDELQGRNQEIFRRFNNANVHELAEEYGVTTVWIYTIVRTVRENLQRQARACEAAARAPADAQPTVAGRHRVTASISN